MTQAPCENCPILREVSAARVAAERAQQEGVINARITQFGETLRRMREIALEETCRVHDCSGIKQDDDGTDRCPQSIGRIGWLVTGDDFNTQIIASNLSSQRQGAGFSGE